jgi:hypothetical protein
MCVCLDLTNPCGFDQSLSFTLVTCEMHDAPTTRAPIGTCSCIAATAQDFADVERRLSSGDLSDDLWFTLNEVSHALAEERVSGRASGVESGEHCCLTDGVRTEKVVKMCGEEWVKSGSKWVKTA